MLVYLVLSKVVELFHGVTRKVVPPNGPVPQRFGRTTDTDDGKYLVKPNIEFVIHWDEF